MYSMYICLIITATNKLKNGEYLCYETYLLFIYGELGLGIWESKSCLILINVELDLVSYISQDLTRREWSD